MSKRIIEKWNNFDIKTPQQVYCSLGLSEYWIDQILVGSGSKKLKPYPKLYV